MVGYPKFGEKTLKNHQHSIDWSAFHKKQIDTYKKWIDGFLKSSITEFISDIITLITLSNSVDEFLTQKLMKHLPSGQGFEEV